MGAVILALRAAPPGSLAAACPAPHTWAQLMATAQSEASPVSSGSRAEGCPSREAGAVLC